MPVLPLLKANVPGKSFNSSTELARVERVERGERAGIVPWTKTIYRPFRPVSWHSTRVYEVNATNISRVQTALNP